MNFLDKIYQNLSNLGGKITSVDATILYVIMLCAVFALALICFVLYFFTPCYKLLKHSKNIIGYLAHVPTVTKANRDEFVNKCFSYKCPKALLASLQVFESIRYGYPSEFVSRDTVYEKSVKASAYPMFLFGALSVLVIVVLGIMLAGVASLNSLFVSILIAFAFAVVLEIVLFLLYTVMRKKALKAFTEMQDELDSKVMLQDLRELVPETEGLAAIADELDKLAQSAQKFSIPENYDDIELGDGVEVVLDEPEIKLTTDDEREITADSDSVTEIEKVETFESAEDEVFAVQGDIEIQSAEVLEPADKTETATYEQNEIAEEQQIQMQETQFQTEAQVETVEPQAQTQERNQELAEQAEIETDESEQTNDKVESDESEQAQDVDETVKALIDVIKDGHKK